MAHTLNLVYGGVTNYLTANDFRLADYVPAAPNKNEQEITETCRLWISSTTIDNLRYHIRELELAFEWARWRKEGKTPYRVYIQFQPQGESVLYQSEIYDGRLVLPDNALKDGWAGAQIEVALIWTRAPYWQAVDWVEVPITNLNGYRETTGLRIYNCADETGAAPNIRENYFDIEAAHVTGDQPGPAKLQISPESGYALNGYYIGQHLNVLSTHLMASEIEDWGSGTVTVDATCSGGEYASLTLPTSWGLLADVLYSMYTNQSAHFRYLLRLKNIAPDGTWLKLRLRHGDLMTETTPVLCRGTTGVGLPTVTLIDLGVLRTGSTIFSEPDWATLELYGRNASGGTLDADVLEILGLDGYQAAWANTAVHDTSINRNIEEFGERKSYVEKSDGTFQKSLFANQSGGGIFLVPGVDQRIAILNKPLRADEEPITFSSLVKVWYKPRRKTL